MKTEDFFNFKGLKAFVTQRKPRGGNFTDGMTFKITKESTWSYQISAKQGVEIVSLAPQKPPPKTKGRKAPSKRKQTT